MSRLEHRIRAILRSGKYPRITLLPGTQIYIPKRRVGRPRVRTQGMPFKHYKDPRSGKTQARCLAKGCSRRLRSNQRGACSEGCADQIVNQSLLALRLVGVPKTELLEIYGE